MFLLESKSAGNPNRFDLIRKNKSCNTDHCKHLFVGFSFSDFNKPNTLNDPQPTEKKNVFVFSSTEAAIFHFPSVLFTATCNNIVYRCFSPFLFRRLMETSFSRRRIDGAHRVPSIVTERLIFFVFLTLSKWNGKKLRYPRYASTRNKIRSLFIFFWGEWEGGISIYVMETISMNT